MNILGQRSMKMTSLTNINSSVKTTEYVSSQNESTIIEIRESVYKSLIQIREKSFVILEERIISLQAQGTIRGSVPLQEVVYKVKNINTDEMRFIFKNPTMIFTTLYDRNVVFKNDGTV